MSFQLSKKLCMVFSITNLCLFLYNKMALNLYIGIAMVVWVLLLEFIERSYE